MSIARTKQRKRPRTLRGKIEELKGALHRERADAANCRRLVRIEAQRSNRLCGELQRKDAEMDELRREVEVLRRMLVRREPAA
jgi:chromosome segregation ATPase